MGSGRGLVVLTVAGLALLCGCGSEAEVEGEIDYHAQMREIPAFADLSDEDLDRLAETNCDLVEKMVAAGRSNQEAVDRIFTLARDDGGLSEADALLAAITIVGANCPIDLSE